MTQRLAVVLATHTLITHLAVDHLVHTTLLAQTQRLIRILFVERRQRRLAHTTVAVHAITHLARLLQRTRHRSVIVTAAAVKKHLQRGRTAAHARSARSSATTRQPLQKSSHSVHGNETEDSTRSQTCCRHDPCACESPEAITLLVVRRKVLGGVQHVDVGTKMTLGEIKRASTHTHVQLAVLVGRTMVCVAQKGTRVLVTHHTLLAEQRQHAHAVHLDRFCVQLIIFVVPVTLGKVGVGLIRYLRAKSLSISS